MWLGGGRGLAPFFGGMLAVFGHEGALFRDKVL